MKRYNRIFWLMLTTCLLFGNATAQQVSVQNVIYINGIQNTLEGAQATQNKIQTVLDSSPNHVGSARRLFVVDLIWNPIGWYPTFLGLDITALRRDLREDKMEMFLLKAAEEKYATSFSELLAPFNRSAVFGTTAAVEVTRSLNNIMPENTSIETNGDINSDNMSATKRATENLFNRVKELRSTVVVAHSQGNLLANLVWAKIASESGSDVSSMMRVVNVANTSQFSVNSLNFTHAGDAALFAAAGTNAFGLQSMPREEGWSRTRSNCEKGMCDFTITSATFTQPTSPIPDPSGIPDALLNIALRHSILDTYLSTATVDVLTNPGISFTSGATRFVDRFEDFLYAAAISLQPTVSGFGCSTPFVGQTMSCTVAGTNPAIALIFSAPGCGNIAEVAGGTGHSRTYTCTPTIEGPMSISLSTAGVVVFTRIVQIVPFFCPLPQVPQNGVCVLPPSQTVNISQVLDDVGASTGAVSNGGITDDTTPTLSGTLSAPVGATQTLRVFNGSTILSPAVVSGTTWTFTPTALANGTFSFTAAVVSADGIEGSRSAAWSLTINSTTPPVVTPPTPVAPTPLAPTGTIMSLTPVFSWSGGSGAANYEINVRDLTTATIILRQQGISTGSTSFTMPAGTLVNARQYRWDISACPNFACSSGFVTSGNLTFTTQVAASPTVTSVSVVPSTPTVGTQATFSVNGTNLQPGYVFSLPGCAATEVASLSASLRQFTCTPTLAGTNLSGTVSTAAGTVLYAFVQTVGAGVVLPLQHREIATGAFHSCALTSAAGVKCWGSNSNSTLSAGQLGDGTSLTRLVPVDVVGLSSGVVAVSAGHLHTCALTTVGGVKCWGQNFGALGDGTGQHSLTPVDVVGLGGGVVAISAGGGHTCALTSTGGVKCWGVMGGYGLGDGTTRDWLVPVDVVGLTDGAVAIAVGNTHTCALTGAGGVKCWGGNLGRLGDGTDQARLAPVDVLGLGSGVMAISAGGTQTCAVTNAGGAKCWGNNVSGALGDGTTVNRRAPVDVAGLTSGVVALSAGDNHTCAVTSGGGVKCWGSDLSGQLGDGAFNVDRLTPVDVTGLNSGITAVSAGGQHTCARNSAGSVKCWGFNGLGGLGDGTTNSRSVPLVDVVGFQPAGNNPFMGSYVGSYAGGESGTWAATISVDSVISASATGDFIGTGSVNNSSGATTIALGGTGASQGFTITFSGAFALQSNGTMTGSGTWTSSSGLTGTWAGARIN